MEGSSNNLTPELLSDKIRASISVEHISIEDVSDGCGSKFFAIIVSNDFEGKPLLQRHRLINEILQEEYQSMHSLQLKTWTPSQWEQQQQG
mmetsp:Transcript_25358/g.33096  ORF Transcript_25358/g.33096 Transcript_25358/m.33096 type:complete len:91 (-) Transcript_25358:102-374(-)